MSEIFTSTHIGNTTRNMLINNERILYVERTEGERVAYVVMFDNGQALQLDEPTGKEFVLALEDLRRPSPPLHFAREYARHERPGRPKRVRPSVQGRVQ